MFHDDNNEPLGPSRQSLEFVPDFHTQAPTLVDTNSTIIQDATQPHTDIQNNITSIVDTTPTSVRRNLQDQTHFSFEHSNLNQETNRLQDFNLRQVIAPSNDVLKKMVPVIVFAIVQGLDEFRDCVPKFLACFTKLKQFLFVDMVESVTIYMRDSHIEETRAQCIQDKEGECTKRTCKKIITSPNQVKSHFVGKKEDNINKKDTIDIQPQIVQHVINYEEGKTSKGFDENDNRSFMSNSHTSNDMQYKDSDNLELINYPHNIKRNKLEFEVDNVSSVEDEFGAQYLSNCDVSSLKGKSPITHKKLKDYTNFENKSNNSIKCKRCENLNFVGKNGPCWTCANKETKNNVFEKMKNQNFKTIMSSEMSNQKTYNVFDNSLLLRSKMNENRQFIRPYDYNENIHSSQLRTFNNLFGVPKEIVFLKSSNSMVSKRKIINTDSCIESLYNMKSLENTLLLDIPSSSLDVSFQTIESTFNYFLKIQNVVTLTFILLKQHFPKHF
jgi:hypothetical protein